MDDVSTGEMTEAAPSAKDVPFRSMQEVRDKEFAEQQKRPESVDKTIRSVPESETDLLLEEPQQRSNERGTGMREPRDKEAERMAGIERENQRLHEDVKSLQKVLDELHQVGKMNDKTNVEVMMNQRKQISDLTNQVRTGNQKYNDLLDNQKREHERCVSHDRALTGHANKLGRENNELQIKLQNTLIECERLRRVEEEQRQRIQNLTEKIFGQTVTISQQENLIEKSVTQYQMAAVSMLSQSVSTSLPDDQVRKTFREMFDEVSEWARANATTTDKLRMDLPELQVFKGDLWRRVDVPQTGPDLNFDFNDDTAVESLLNAALAKELCRDFLQRPFFFADHTHPMKASEQRPRSDQALGKIFQLLLQHEHDTAAAHAWRAMTVQTLSQASGAQERIEGHFREAAEDFLKDFSFLIKSDLPTEEKENVMEIFKAFGNFSIRLWSHKYDVSYRSLRTLQNRPFMSSSLEMAAADAVKLEENDKSLDGRPVVVVLQPLVEGHGTPDGKEYNKRKIWSKAKVWVSSDTGTRPRGEERAKEQSAS